MHSKAVSGDIGPAYDVAVKVRAFAACVVPMSEEDDENYAHTAAATAPCARSFAHVTSLQSRATRCSYPPLRRPV